MEFVAFKNDLRRAISVVSLSVDSAALTPVDAHALFRLEGDKVSLFSTNKDMVSSATMVVKDVKIAEGETNEFTVEPKKILSLIAASDVDDIRFSYDPEKMTLSVYASEDQLSHLSFPSCDPEKFLKTFIDSFSKATKIKSMNSGILVHAIRFISGFLPTDVKNKKYQHSYIDDGIIYGSDGSNKIGAFGTPDFKGIESLVIRKEMISPIVALIEKSDMDTVKIQSTSKMIILSSEDGSYNFGFLRVPKDCEPPKLSLPIKKPDVTGFNLNKDILLKRLKRLSISATENVMGISISLDEDGNRLTMKSLNERESVESMECSKLQGDEPVKFVAEYRLMKNVLSLFKTEDVDLFVDNKKRRYTAMNRGSLQYFEKGEEKSQSFESMGIVSLAWSEGA